jgi:WD40 repeat protein
MRDDGTLRLWDITDPTHPAALTDPITVSATDVPTIAFSPDGHTLVTISDDSNLQLWETDPDQAIRRICAATGHTLTAQRWRQYVGALRYQPPCP